MFPIFQRRLTPIRLGSVPLWAQALFVGIAILNDQTRHSVRMEQRQVQPDWAAVVVEVERKPVESDCLG